MCTEISTGGSAVVGLTNISSGTGCPSFFDPWFKTLEKKKKNLEEAESMLESLHVEIKHLQACRIQKKPPMFDSVYLLCGMMFQQNWLIFSESHILLVFCFWVQKSSEPNLNV